MYPDLDVTLSLRLPASDYIGVDTFSHFKEGTKSHKKVTNTGPDLDRIFTGCLRSNPRASEHNALLDANISIPLSYPVFPPALTFLSSDIISLDQAAGYITVAVLNT